MVTIKFTARERLDLAFAIELAVEDLDGKFDMADNDTDRHACEATAERLAALQHKLAKAAQKAAS